MKIPRGSNKKIYKCLECIDGFNGEYRVSKDDGKCCICNKPPCSECHYKKGTLDDYICAKCQNDYYLSNERCIQCYYQYNNIIGGYCANYYCPGGTHSKINYCKCNSNYVLTTQNTCIPNPSNCSIAIYDQNTNSAKCILCKYLLYLTDQGVCVPESPLPRDCFMYHYDQNKSSFICDSCNFNYVLTNQGTCIPYPSNCSKAHYDQNTNSSICDRCINNSYALNSDNECIYCGANCNYCKFKDGKIACIYCFENYLWNGTICAQINAPENCYTHKKEIFNKKNEYICTRCYSNYALDSINNKCIKCPSYCQSCHFDYSKILICDNCASDYVLDETKLCEFCTSNEIIGGEGCIHCKYENGINKCTDCRNDYIYINNDHVCKLPSEINLNIGCKNATRLENGGYTCNKRRSNISTMITKYNNIIDYYPSENELVNCEKGYEDENKNLSCIKCIYNYRFIWSEEYKINICDNHCDSDYFFNYNLKILGCYKCDDENGGGQIGCNPEKGCSYIAADNHLYCNSCKTGYYFDDWKCLTCSKKDINCIECDFIITKKKFKCNKCINDKFYVNDETGLCDTIINSNNNTKIIIIVCSIILAIIIAILIIILIRKLSKKKNGSDNVIKYDSSGKHKRSIKNIKKEPYYTSTVQTMKITESNSKKGSINIINDSEKFPTKLSQVEIKVYKKEK